jgi:intracellular multiplication protein IcmM
MIGETWEIIKNNKSFDVTIYRRGLVVLIISLLLNCIFGLLLFYSYLAQPERAYYATNGETPPVKLTAIFAPNLSSKALLDPDPPTDEAVRVIPQ